MATSKREMAGWLIVGAALFGSEQATGQDAFGRRAPSTEIRGIVKSVDATAGKITIVVAPGRQEDERGDHQDQERRSHFPSFQRVFCVVERRSLARGYGMPWSDVRGARLGDLAMMRAVFLLTLH